MDKRKMIGNFSLFAAVLIITTACFHFYSWYSVMAPYGTLIAAAFLAVTFFCYVDIKTALKDKYFYLMVFADALALIHLIIVKSNLGAILTVADFLLILYLSDKIRFSKLEMIISAFYIGFFFLYWTVDVKGYFKGYNTNYGGLVLITGFVFLIFAYEYMMLHKWNNLKRGWILLLRAFELFLFALAGNIIAWYRSRCALMGLIVFIILFLIPKKVWNNKALYSLLSVGGTIGSVAFSLLYVWLGRMKEIFTVRLFYKDIISGREEIWEELWGEFLKKPITGIGSSYVIKLEWMEGIFEVHSGLLDILIVHGIAVFAVTVFFLLKNLFEVRSRVFGNYMCKVAFSGIFAMLITAFIENFIIVAPFSICFMFLFVFINSYNE